MRVLSSLQKTKNVKQWLETDNNPEYTFYDKYLKDKYMIMPKVFSSVRDNETYKKMIIASHPFELIRTKIHSMFTPGSFKITNAFMKIWEIFLWLDDRYDFFTKDNILTMYDVAGAPGMFVLGAENFLNTYFPTHSLDWHACSLEGGTALTDNYGLYKNNISRYTPCNVLIEKDVRKCINEQPSKFRIVTGDIGIYHDDDYDTLQEEKQLDLEWSQMYLAINLVETRGFMILKMYSMVTIETIYLLDTIAQYFDNVYVIKPYCTRVFNDESYIICVNRNEEPLDINYKRPFIKAYMSYNIDIIKSFENARLDIKYRMFELIRDLISDDIYGSSNVIQRCKSNIYYKCYYDELSPLLSEFYSLSR